jgi:hypothetical protein
LPITRDRILTCRHSRVRESAMSAIDFRSGLYVRQDNEWIPPARVACHDDGVGRLSPSPYSSCPSDTLGHLTFPRRQSLANPLELQSLLLPLVWYATKPKSDEGTSAESPLWLYWAPAPRKATRRRVEQEPKPDAGLPVLPSSETGATTGWHSNRSVGMRCRCRANVRVSRLRPLQVSFGQGHQCRANTLVVNTFGRLKQADGFSPATFALVSHGTNGGSEKPPGSQSYVRYRTLRLDLRPMEEANGPQTARPGGKGHFTGTIEIIEG